MTKWYNSKTVWFNIVTGILALLAFPQLISIIPAAAEPYIAILNALGNYVLRVYFTNTAIGTNTPPQS